MWTSNKFISVGLLILGALSFFSCDRRDNDPESPDKYKEVFILYSAGRNDLTFSLQQDIKDLTCGYIPKINDEKAIVVIGHHSDKSSSFVNPATPYAIRIYKDKRGNVIRDTLKAFRNDMMLTRPKDMDSLLCYVKNNFKSDSYGMLFSSHGTGWLPKGYYSNPTKFDSGKAALKKGVFSTGASAQSYTDGGGIVIDESELPDGPAFTKSAGCEYSYENKETVRYELNLQEFASAIPMHMDYIIFDSCLMGGIETAYELKSKCDYIVFSQAEVLSDGFDYLKIGSRLLEGSTPDLQQVCQDFFNLYKDKTGSSCTATVSLIDCAGLDYLAKCCKTLFEDYRDKISSLKPSQVQPFSRPSKNWFFDLEDILLKAGISTTEKNELKGALAECVIFKLTTKRILDMYDVDSFCGLSMFLPSSGTRYLLDFYETLSWNSASKLVD